MVTKKKYKILRLRPVWTGGHIIIVRSLLYNEVIGVKFT